MTIDIDKLGGDIIASVQKVIQGNFPTLTTYAQAQLKAITKQTALIAEGLIDGWIDTPQEKMHWSKTLTDMATEFARTIKALVMITVEKVLNAILDVLRTALKSAIPL